MIAGGYYEKAADQNDYFYFERSDNNTCRTHFHKNIEILFVERGAHKVRINGEERILTVGDIAVSNSYDVHKYDCENSSTVSIIVLGGEYLRRFYRLNSGVFENFLYANERTQEIFSALKTLGEHSGSELKKYGYVDVLLGIMTESYKLVTQNNKNNIEIVKILEFINDNFCENMSLDTIGKRFGYDKNYLSNIFNKYVGMHLRDYVNRLRIDKAQKLLTEDTKNRKIIDIALDCGFQSANTYYRALKKFSDDKYLAEN